MSASKGACNDYFHAARDRPPGDEIRQQLGLIVGSPVFRVSLRLTSFLKFVVEAVLSGDGDNIKAYTIAVEAFGRSPSFDPQADPIVRVEAGRLRHALARYYAGAGRDDPLTIDLPRGTYVPAFHRRDAERAGPAGASPRADGLAEIARRRRQLHRSLIAIRDLVEIHRRQVAALAAQIETAAAEAETLAYAATASFQAASAHIATASAAAAPKRDPHACGTPTNSACRHGPCRQL
jgi:hypothetical protein